MKRVLNKIITLIICLSLGINLIPAFAAESDGGFEPAEYNEAVSMLNDLGIFEDEYFASYDSSIMITRGEFASLAVSVMGMYDEAKATAYTQRFTDVSADYPYAKEINFAASLGLFNGVSQTEFAPDDPVYITQALKVAVSMLGYKEMAEVKGGYPTGYLTVARAIDILDGVNMNSDSPALRGNIIILMYNTLFADVMQISGVNGDSYSFEITDGDNLLSVYHKIYEDEGVVTSNWEYSIVGETDESGYMSVNGTRYVTDSKRAIGSVGKNVKYYYKKDGTSNKIITLREYENDIVNINAGDGYTFDYSLGQYTVTGEDKNYVFKLSDYDIVYNYGCIDGSVPVNYRDILTPDNGTITLIDNNMDKIYDVVIIEESEILLFKSFDKYSEIIYDMNDRSVDIKYDDYDKVSVCDVTGADVDLSKVEKMSVIMVYKSFDKKYVKAVICSNTVEGTVDEITSDSIIIGKSEYKFSNTNRITGLLPGQTYNTIIFPGQTYIFYLNQYNQIVYHDVKATLYTGYIADIAPSTSAMDKSMYVHMFTSADKLEQFKLASKVKVETINGKQSVDSKDVPEKLQQYASTIYASGINPESRMFIQYGLNADKEINHIMLPHLLDEKDEYENPPSNYSFFKLDYILTKIQSVGTRIPADHATNTHGKEYFRVGYVPANNSAGLTMTMDNNSTVFYVPEFSNLSYSDNNFSLQNVKSLARGTAFCYFPEFDGTLDQIEVFSTDREVRLVNNVVWIKRNGHATPITNSAEDAALVTSVTNVVSEDGDPLVKLTVLESKKIYDIYSDNLDVVKRATFEDTAIEGYKGSVLPTLHPNKTSIAPGDLIRFSTNADGYVNDIALLYDAENNVMSYLNADSFTKHTVQYRHTCGEVTDMYGSYAVLDVFDSSTTQKSSEPLIVSSFFRCYVYDYDTKEARLGSSSDISIGDKVYFTMYYTMPTDGEIIIYKGGNR